MPAEHRSHLVMPLLPLTSVREPSRDAPQAAATPVPRLLDLDDPSDTGLALWAARVRAAAESCVLVDEHGRVAAMSIGCGLMLNLDPVGTVGALLLDLIVMVDFSAAGLPLPDPELQAPPLRALKSGGLARGLVRLRRPMGTLTTYDVVGVPLAGGLGALGFLTEV